MNRIIILHDITNVLHNDNHRITFYHERIRRIRIRQQRKRRRLYRHFINNSII